MMLNNYSKRNKQVVQKLSCIDSSRTFCHEQRRGEPMPSSEVLGDIVNILRDVIFPGYFGNSNTDPESLGFYLGVNVERVFNLLSDQILAGLCFSCPEKDDSISQSYAQKAREMTAQFIEALPRLREYLALDVQAAFNGDPAAQSFGEVIFCYPAIRAIINYRIAHELLKLNVPLIPRIITEMAHSETGIDIHPKARIGKSFTIDHGTGVVIGATSIIGDRVKLYQGVTLGAKSFPLDEEGHPIKGIPRHPILEDDVIIYSNATILGRITIGEGSVVGGNIWVTNSVPPGSKIVQVKARDGVFTEGAGI